jgi:hypothetical protein
LHGLLHRGGRRLLAIPLTRLSQGIQALALRCQRPLQITHKGAQVCLCKGGVIA